MPGEAADAESESSLLSILQVDVPGLDLHFQVEFNLGLKRSESTHVVEALEDIVQAFIAELGGSAEEPNRLRSVENFDRFKQRALNGVESWRQKLQQVEQWQIKVDKASTQLTKMREGYLKELTFLREQLQAKAKAERSGVEFIPSSNVQLFSAEGAFAPLDDPVDKARLEFQAQLAEEREQARTRILSLNEQLRIAKMTISRKERLIGRFMEKEEEADSDDPNSQNGEVEAAGGEPPAPDADAPTSDRLRFREHLEQKFGGSASAAMEFSARYCNPEGLKFKEFAALVEAVGYPCDVQELFAALQRPGSVVLADLLGEEVQDSSAGPKHLRDAVLEPRRAESASEGKRPKHGGHGHPAAKRAGRPDGQHQPPAPPTSCCVGVQTIMDSATLAQVFRACEGQLVEDAWRAGGGEASTLAARKGSSAGGGGSRATSSRPRRRSLGRASEDVVQGQREELLLHGSGGEDGVDSMRAASRRCSNSPTNGDLQPLRLSSSTEALDREVVSQGAAAGDISDPVRLPSVQSFPTVPRRNSAPELQRDGSEGATPSTTALPEPASARQHRSGSRGAVASRLTRSRLAEVPPPLAPQWAEDGPGCEARLRHVEELASELELRLPEIRSHIEWLASRIEAKTVSRQEQLLQERLAAFAGPPKADGYGALQPAAAGLLQAHGQVAGVSTPPPRRSYQNTVQLMEGLVDNSVNAILAKHGVHLPAAEARDKDTPSPPASRPSTTPHRPQRRSSFHKSGTPTSASSASTALGPAATPRVRGTAQADDGMQGEDHELLAIGLQGERAKTATHLPQVGKKKRMDLFPSTNSESRTTSTSFATSLAVATLDTLASDSSAEDFALRQPTPPSSSLARRRWTEFTAYPCQAAGSRPAP